MGARHKINVDAINGILIVAGLIALLTKSWAIFCVAAVALLFTSLLSGDIRFSSRK